MRLKITSGKILRNDGVLCEGAFSCAWSEHLRHSDCLVIQKDGTILDWGHPVSVRLTTKEERKELEAGLRCIDALLASLPEPDG